MGGEGQGLRFTPASITVAEGDVVRFVSADAGPHDVTFEGAGLSSQAQTQLDRNISERAEPMKSVTLSEAGETVTVSFSGINPGRYAFHCSIHAEAGMNGVIDVR
jgi:plastocyanin